MKRPKTFVDDDNVEHNGSDIQDAYERACEDKREREREELTGELSDIEISNFLNELP